MSTRVQSIERGIDILMAIANGSRTLTEIARETQLSKATAFRLLASLAHEQLVVRDPDETVYVLGPGFLRMFQGAMTNLGGIATLARGALQELWERVDETVTLHVRIGYERICVSELPSSKPLRYTATVGSTAPIYVGSAGKVLLAFMLPNESAPTVSDLELKPVTHLTITDRERLRDEMVAIARQGWAMSEGERMIGAAAISVPIRGNAGLLAALSVLGPLERMSQATRLAMLPDLRRAAVAVELALNSHAGARAEAAATS